jgi:molybdopterin converting factor small subunit
MTTVFIPTPMRKTTNNKSTIEVDPGSVDEVLARCSSEFPELRGQLFDDKGLVKRYINIFVNGNNIHALEGMGTRVVDRDEVIIVPAMAGG